MGTVTFSEFKTSIKQSQFPFGTPENLETTVDKMVVEGLILVQRYVRCYQENHIDVFDSTYGSYTSCGITYIPKPRGIIGRIRNRWKDSDPSDSGDAATEAAEQDHCDTYDYSLTTLEEVNAIAREILNVDLSNCRLRWGCYTVGNANIGITPPLASDEEVELHWSGIKREYADGDLVPDDPELEKAVGYYVSQQYSGNYDKDLEAYQVASAGWANALAELQYDCREHGGPILETPEDDLGAAVAFTFVSDGGLAGASQLGVSQLTAQFNPDVLLFGGNNNYTSGDPADLDKNWAAYDSQRKRNVIFPALGAVDLDWEDGKPQVSYFDLPGNGRYYQFRRGPVEFFCIDSGINSAAAVVEPDGNTSVSVQGQWLEAALAASDADWKVVYFHHSPYTNDTSLSPGNATLRWPFDTWGAHVVLSGQAHNYERLLVGGFPYFVVGTGGHSLTGFIGVPSADSQKRYSDNYGVLRVVADRQRMLFRFYSMDGNLQDVYALSK